MCTVCIVNMHENDFENVVVVDLSRLSSFEDDEWGLERYNEVIYVSWCLVPTCASALLFGFVV